MYCGWYNADFDWCNPFSSGSSEPRSSLETSARTPTDAFIFFSLIARKTATPTAIASSTARTTMTMTSVRTTDGDESTFPVPDPAPVEPAAPLLGFGEAGVDGASDGKAGAAPPAPDGRADGRGTPFVVVGTMAGRMDVEAVGPSGGRVGNGFGVVTNGIRREVTFRASRAGCVPASLRCNRCSSVTAL